MRLVDNVRINTLSAGGQGLGNDGLEMRSFEIFNGSSHRVLSVVVSVE